MSIALHKVYTSTEGNPLSVVPRMVAKRDGVESVWFEELGLNRVFVPDSSGYAPLPLWAFTSSFEETADERPPGDRPFSAEVPPRAVPVAKEPRTSPVGEGESRIDHEEEMLSRAFGISDEWYHATDDYIDESFERADKVTQVAIGLIRSIREEELGVDDLSNWSDYEMKLFYGGFMVAQKVAHDKHRAALLSTLLSMAMDGDMADLLKMLKDLRDEMQNGGDEDSEE